MEKYLIIPRGKETPYRKLLLAWHTGIDPVVLANGDFILNDGCLDLVKNYPEKTVTVDAKIVTIENALKVYPLKNASEIIFKVEAQIEP
jgi:hypothetical protein